MFAQVAPLTLHLYCIKRSVAEVTMREVPSKGGASTKSLCSAFFCHEGLQRRFSSSKWKTSLKERSGATVFENGSFDLHVGRLE
jgi:hypothetical protein